MCPRLTCCAGTHQRFQEDESWFTHQRGESQALPGQSQVRRPQQATGPAAEPTDELARPGGPGGEPRVTFPNLLHQTTTYIWQPRQQGTCADADPKHHHLPLPVPLERAAGQARPSHQSRAGTGPLQPPAWPPASASMGPTGWGGALKPP